MRPWITLSSTFVLGVLAAGQCWAQLPNSDGGTVERGVLPDRWVTGGPKCMEMPEWQVHEYNPDLYLLRQVPAARSQE